MIELSYGGVVYPAYQVLVGPGLQVTESASGQAQLSVKLNSYGAPTGTATRTTFATGSVTLVVLAEHVKALIDDLTS